MAKDRSAVDILAPAGTGVLERLSRNIRACTSMACATRRHRSRTTVACGCLFLAAFVVGAPASTAQQISVTIGDGSVNAVAPATQVQLPIVVDMSQAEGLDIASLTFELTWEVAGLSFVSVSGGDLGTLTFNEVNTASGSLVGSMFSATGATSTFVIATLELEAAEVQGLSAMIAIGVTAAGDESGTDILQYLRTSGLTVCIELAGFFGDVTGDEVVNIIDAQQIARYSIGLPTPGVDDPSRFTTHGDVNTDGTTNIIDAQQIARFSVGLPTPGAPSVGSVMSGGCLALEYDIEFRYITAIEPGETTPFNHAAIRWQHLLVGDVPDVDLVLAADGCGTGSPEVDETIDDVVIFVRLEAIDGPGGVLGAAGPCVVRPSSHLPALGTMFFDTADLDYLQASGLLQAVIVHEMGHVLGFGTIWADEGLLVGAGGPDPYFAGAGAISAFNSIGGEAYQGNPVPVENTGGVGTRDAHWRESVFGNELMTGWINEGSNPLSVVTVASMGDLGYEVDLSAADSYTLLSPLRALQGAPTGIHLMDDIWRGPTYEVGGDGRVRLLDSH